MRRLALRQKWHNIKKEIFKLNLIIKNTHSANIGIFKHIWFHKEENRNKNQVLSFYRKKNWKMVKMIEQNEGKNQGWFYSLKVNINSKFLLIIFI